MKRGLLLPVAVAAAALAGGSGVEPPPTPTPAGLLMRVAFMLGSRGDTPLPVGTRPAAENRAFDDWDPTADKMLRVSWDDGVTWYGFRPVFTDSARGLLAIRLEVREELGRGEVGWREKAGITLTAGKAATSRAALAAASANRARSVSGRRGKPSPSSRRAPGQHAGRRLQL